MLWDFLDGSSNPHGGCSRAVTFRCERGGERNGEYLRCVLFNHICPSDDCGAFPNNKFLEAPFLLVMIDVINLGGGFNVFFVLTHLRI